MPAYKEHDPQTGITTTVHYVEDANKVAIQKTYDAEPFVETAAEMRAQTEGERWGEMRHIGFIPMAELSKMLRQDGTVDKKRCMEFLKQNPALCTFTKALR
jgi:hypothetical protein